MERVVVRGVFRQEAIFEQEINGRAQVCPVHFIVLFTRGAWVLCVRASHSFSQSVSQHARQPQLYSVWVGNGTVTVCDLVRFLGFVFSSQC